MPFREVNITELIEQECKSDPEFKEILEKRRMEYKFLEQLIKLRNEKGLTQKELADKAGYKNQQTISKIEKHEKSPTLSTLCQVARALDMELTLTPINH